MLFLLVFVSACALSMLLTSLVCDVAYRRSWLDQPSPRRVHSSPTPRLGGVAMFSAFATVLLLLVITGHLEPYACLGLLAGAGSLVVVGFVDDVWGVGPGLKFAFQLAAALVTAVAFDIAIQGVTVPFAGYVHLSGSVVGYVATVFWILGMINTVNFADGIDGLAGGLAFIFAAVLFAVGLRLEQEQLPLYAAALGGTALGFLRYNFPPARTFMGDSGSMFLGYTMGVLSVLGTAKLATGLLVLGLPVVDVGYSIIRRVKAGAPVQRPDREHLHHRLLMLGLSQRTTAGVFYLLALGFGSAAIIPHREIRLAALISLGLLSLGIIWAVNVRLGSRSRRELAGDEQSGQRGSVA